MIWPHSVYSTWGYHDELGDRVHLDEALVMRALGGLERWRDAGLRQDYFHIDCFWFDPSGGYLRFDPQAWPRGFEPALERMRRARAAFFDAWQRGLATGFVGGGEPGVAPWHGYLTGEGHAGLLYLVNPRLDPVTVTLTLANLADARVLFHDGAAPPAAQAQPDRLTVRLQPEQMALIGLGDYADERWAIGEQDADDAAASIAEAAPVDCAFRETPSGLAAEVPAPPAGMRLLVRAEALGTPEQSLQDAEPFVFARQNLKDSSDRTPAAHAPLAITATVAGRPVPPAAQVPDVPIWSGVSWVSQTFELSGPATVQVAQDFSPRRRLRVGAFWIR